MSSSPSLSRPVLWLLAGATGLCVGNLYYCQPLLGQMQQSLQVEQGSMGWIPTLTQVGYALGMLFLIPLGDRFERRGLIVTATVASALALIGMALSSSLLMAALMSLLIGIATMTPQFIIPFVAHRADPARRGEMVATVMSGLLLGILLARTVAGFLGEAIGWRWTFAVAAMVLLVLALVLRWALPTSHATYAGSYGALLRSTLALVREQPVLRESMFYGGALFAAFSAFWATLIHLLETPAFDLGARAVGLFGLIGAAGALAAPVFGKLADRRDPRYSIGAGIAVTLIAFAIYGFWGGTSLIALTLGVLLMDVGVQAGHIANQSRYFVLVPEARSRLNTAYMCAYFSGGAAGSALGSWAWAAWGWSGVCLVGAGFAMLAGSVFVGQSRRAA